MNFLEGFISFLKGEEKFYTGVNVSSTYSCAAKLKGNKREQELEYVRCVNYGNVFRNEELVDSATLVANFSSLEINEECACGIPNNKVFYTVIEEDKEKNPLVAVTEKVKDTFGENVFEKMVIKWKEIPYERVEGKKDIAIFLIKKEDFEEIKKFTLRY